MRRSPSVAVAPVVAAVILAACSGAAHQPAGSAATSHGSVAGAAASSTAWVALGGGARVLVPQAWQQIQYQGEPATVVYPIVFLTDGRLAGRCVTGPPSSACTGQAWFAPHWTTPSNGVLLSWLNVSIPGPATDRHFLSYVHARTIMLAHRPAKIVRGPVTSCPTGTTLEIDAYVQQSPAGYPGDRLDMRACLGAHAPATTRHAVMRMLHSLRFGRRAR